MRSFRSFFRFWGHYGHFLGLKCISVFILGFRVISKREREIKIEATKRRQCHKLYGLVSNPSKQILLTLRSQCGLLSTTHMNEQSIKMKIDLLTANYVQITRSNILQEQIPNAFRMKSLYKFCETLREREREISALWH